MNLRPLLPLLILCAGCQLTTNPFVGKWEAVVNPNEQVPLYLRAMTGGKELPVIRLNMEIRDDKTFKMALPAIGEVTGTWATKENGRLALKVTGGAEGQMRTSMEGLELMPSDGNRKLTLVAPTAVGLPVTLLFTRADGK